LKFEFVEPWHLFLPADPGHVISVMGSGGKTSLLKAFAAVYAARDLPVILTTTTLTEPLEDLPAVAMRDLGDAEIPQLPPVFFLHDGVTTEGKWEGLLPRQVDDLGGRMPERNVLVEVDGAAKMPFKLHREGEPVWPARTSLAVVAMGIGAVGKPAGDILHRFGRVQWEPLGSLEADTVWEWDHAHTLLVESGGYLSQVPPEVPCVLALTGLDQQADSIGLFDFVGRAMNQTRFPLAMFCDLTAAPEVIRTVCRPESGKS
jgi:probable selenium-dependent hydroxylase accessory protein YqeC